MALLDTPGRPAPDLPALLFALGERGATVAVAESLTGGLVTAALVEVPGASRVLRGGVVAYAAELKHSLLGVDVGVLARSGPVDPDVAAQMAGGVRARLGASIGLATTGVAGPGPQDGVPAGRVFVAVDRAGAPPLVERLDLDGDRPAVRREAAVAVLRLLADALT